MKLYWALLLAPALLPASVITPISYSYTSGTPAGESIYTDPLLTKLTDGVVGAAVTTDGTWVGWQFGDGGTAEITFDFGSVVTIETVSLDLLRDTANNVQVPATVFINGDSFSPSNFGADPHRGFIDFTGSWTGSSMVVQLDHTTSIWGFINEATFNSSIASVPEPGTLALVIGPALIWLGRRRRAGRN